MSTPLKDFMDWFRRDNMFYVEQASVSQVVNAIRRYTYNDTDMELDLREELFGPSGYLVRG